MPLRLLGLIAIAFAVVVASLFSVQANTLMDPDGRLRGGTPETVKIKGLFDMLALRRSVVPFETKEKPGTVIVFTKERMLYLVLAPGQAMRYGVGVGRDGFTWHGIHTVTNKREWPDWRPPPE
jgi:lipoprotein-anchoring transpeptidase ErfK/SrfK